MNEQTEIARLRKQVARLQEEVTQRHKSDKINHTLYQIADSVSSSSNLDELFKSIHNSLTTIIDTTNFFIAFYDQQNQIVTFPYAIDLKGSICKPIINGTRHNSLCMRVIEDRRSLLITEQELIRQHKALGSPVFQGLMPKVWLGVPLITRGNLIGVIAVQNYDQEDIYNHNDVELLEAIAAQVAVAIERKRIETELHQTNTRYRSLNNAALNGFCIQSNSTILECNQALLEMTGYDKKELLGMNAYNLISSEWHNWIKSPSTTPPYIVRGKRKNGSTYDLQYRVTEIPYKGKTATLCELSDISAFKNIERALSLTEQQYKVIFDNSPLGIVYFNSDGTVLDCNNKLLELMGATRKDLIGFKVPKQFNPDIKNAITEAINGNISVFEGPYTSVSGNKSSYLQIIFNPITPEQTPSPVIAAIEDISERKKAEEAAKESALRIKRFFSAIHDAVFVHPVQKEGFGKFIEVNDIACERYGYSREEFLQLSPADITHETFSKQHKTVAHRQKLFSEKCLVFEALHKKQSGETFPVEISTNIVEQDGKPYILAVVRDVTERKTAEAEKQKLVEQLQQAQKMESIGRLAGGIAHDFNNMLAVILGRTELIMDSDFDWLPFSEDLIEIEKAANRSAELTGQLLAFARKQTITPQNINLNLEVGDLLNMLKRIIGEQIKLIWQPDESLWSVKIDPGQLNQLLTNLCVNARDAIEERSGKIIISLRNIHVLEKIDQKQQITHSGEYVLLSVKDNGCGMSREVQDKLFEPFYTTKEIGKGTGLGLSTVYGITYQNKGFIEVESTVNRGSTFNIYLPRSVALKIDKCNQLESEAEAPVTGAKSILLIEDEIAMLNLTKRLLKRFGHKVLAYDNPKSALSAIKDSNKEFDLLLTDVIMPEMNGRQLAKSITELQPDIQCLFMSGYTNDILEGTGMWENEVHFLQKPYTKEELGVKLEEIFLLSSKYES